MYLLIFKFINIEYDILSCWKLNCVWGNKDIKFCYYFILRIKN